MAEARARRNQGKFSRLRAMADRNWRCSRRGDFGLALWNKRAADCVYEFEVCRVSGSCLWVRFHGEDQDTQIVPEKMPVVTTSSADLMQELRAECSDERPLERHPGVSRAHMQRVCSGRRGLKHCLGLFRAIK